MTNSRIKKIYLHIGFNKTATSSIQKSLYLSRKVLQNDGWLYPDFSSVYNQFCTEINHNAPLENYCKDSPEKFHLNIQFKINTDEKISILKQIFFQSFTHQAKSSECHSAIISAESLITFNESELGRLTVLLHQVFGNDVTVEVIVFVRHPVYYAQSIAQQGVKTGHNVLKKITNFLFNSSSSVFQSVISRYINTFGRASIKVFSFEEALQHPFGILGKFLSIIGFPEDRFPLIPQLKINESISSEAVFLLSEINRKFPIIIDNQWNDKRENLNLTNLINLPGQKFSFSIDDQKRIWNNSEEDRTWLIKNFNLPPYEFNSEHLSSYNNLWGIETLKQLEIIVSDLHDELKKIIAQVLESEMWRSDGSITEDSKKLMESQIKSIRDSLPVVVNEKPMRRLVFINRTNFESYFKAELSNPSLCMVSEGMFKIQPVNLPFVLNLPKVIRSYESKTLIIFDIHSSKNSTVTLEYQTQGNIEFETSFSPGRFVNEGMNDIEFEITDFDFNGKTRLIFHDGGVRYKIQSIEIKTDSPSYDDLFKENVSIKKQIESLEKTRANFFSPVNTGLSLFSLKVKNLLKTVKSRLF